MDRVQNMVRWLRQGFRLDFLVLGLLLLTVFPYSARLNNPNERTRVLQTWSIVEHGQLHMGETLRDRRGRILFKDIHGNLSRRPFVNDIALGSLSTELDAGGGIVITCWPFSSESGSLAASAPP